MIFSNKCNIFILLIILISMMSGISVAQENIETREDQYNNLRMTNEYIAIVINQNDNSKGRFAVETTGGAPYKESDKNKPLVYGRPNPWTSYTTIRIDGKNYVFGGETERRAGKDANYGEVIKEPVVEDNIIKSSYRINGIVVEQNLSIVKSSTTGLYDTAQIKYKLTNNSEQDKNIGLRVMLDTMLGENDGAPLRMGEEAITTDKLFSKNEISNFYQAFDSISEPKVTSQGTLKGPGVTVPDNVYFSDWGSLADGSWDFDFNPGEEFIRKGGYEVDSAVAMYWENNKLAPGESKIFTTNYGLGGISIVPGLLSLGVTSPAEFIFDKPDKSFPVIAYIENTSDIEAKSVNANLNISDNFIVDKVKKDLGNLDSGEIRQVEWQVKPKVMDIYQQKDSTEFSVEVKADNTDSNKVTRSIDLVGPPGLKTSVNVMDELIVKRGRIIPNPFTITAQVENTGGSTLYDTYSEIILPPGITLADYEKTSKYLGPVKPGEKIKINWEVKSLNVEGGFEYAVVTDGLHGYNQTAKEKMNLPGIKPTIYFRTNKTPENNDLITVDICAENFERIKNMDLRISYDQEKLKAIMVYPGDIFVEEDKVVNWNSAEINNGIIRLKNILPENHNGNILGSIQFRIKEGNELPLSWHQVFFADSEGNEIKIENIKGVFIDEENIQ
ncbi:MAG: hypothetical protein ACQEQD_04765 [Bacillota bacterium]